MKSQQPKRNWIVGTVAVVAACAVAVVVAVFYISGGLFSGEPPVIEDCGDMGAAPKPSDEYQSEELGLESADDAEETPKGVSADGRYTVGVRDGMDAPEDTTVMLRHDGQDVDTSAVIPGGDYSTAFGVNSSGDVIGGIEKSKVGGWVFRDEKFVELKGPDGSRDVEPRAIADDGTIVGYFGATYPTRVPVMWEPGEVKATELPIDDGLHGKAIGISSTGIIIGNVYDGKHPEKSESTYAWVWDTDGNGRKLSELVDFPSGKKHEESWAFDIACDWVVADTGSDFIKVKLATGEVEVVKGIDESWDDAWDYQKTAIDGHGRVFGTEKTEDEDASAGIFDDGFTPLPGLEARKSDEESNSIIDMSQDGCVGLGRRTSIGQPVWLTCER